MAARKATAHVTEGLSRRRIAAILAQLGSWWTTWLFCTALGGETANGFVVFGISVALEWVLFEGKRAMLEGKKDALGWVSFVSDALLNAGGLWAFVLALDATETYQMLAAGLNLGDEMRLLPALAIALALGAWLSLAPHQLWKEE